MRYHWPKVFFTQKLQRVLGQGQKHLPVQTYHSWLLEQLNKKLAQSGYRLSQHFSPDISEAVLGNDYFNGWLMSCEPQGVISLLITRFSNLTSRSDCSQWQPFYLHNAKVALRSTVNAVMLQLSSAQPCQTALSYTYSPSHHGAVL